MMKGDGGLEVVPIRAVHRVPQREGGHPSSGIQPRRRVELGDGGIGPGAHVGVLQDSGSDSKPGPPCGHLSPDGPLARRPIVGSQVRTELVPRVAHLHAGPHASTERHRPQCDTEHAIHLGHGIGVAADAAPQVARGHVEIGAVNGSNAGWSSLGRHRGRGQAECQTESATGQSEAGPRHSIEMIGSAAAAALGLKRDKEGLICDSYNQPSILEWMKPHTTITIRNAATAKNPHDESLGGIRWEKFIP